MLRSGLNVAGATRPRDAVVDVDPDVAAYLTEGGHAATVVEDPPAVPEPSRAARPRVARSTTKETR